MTITSFQRSTLMVAALVMTAGFHGQSQSRRIPDSRLTGYWYMGTMTGQDCNLIIDKNGTLQIRFGGCFSQGPWIQGAWLRQNDLLLINLPGLAASLGSTLAIATYKGSVVLVPQATVQQVAKVGFRKDVCFWPNLLGPAGLEISRDADDFPWSHK